MPILTNKMAFMGQPLVLPLLRVNTVMLRVNTVMMLTTMIEQRRHEPQRVHTPIRTLSQQLQNAHMLLLRRLHALILPSEDQRARFRFFLNCEPKMNESCGVKTAAFPFSSDVKY